VLASVLGHARYRGLTVREFPGTAPARNIYLLHRKRPTALVTDIITVITRLHQRQAPPPPEPSMPPES
jgi:hypothetical protein